MITSENLIFKKHQELLLYNGKMIFPSNGIQFLIWDAVRDLVSFIQFIKPEKQPWTSVTFSKTAGFSLQLY